MSTTTTAKAMKHIKRPAPPLAGPHPKKPHLDKDAKRRAVTKVHPKTIQKRKSRPVTDDGLESASSSDDGSDGSVSDGDDDDAALHPAQDPNGTYHTRLNLTVCSLILATGRGNLKGTKPSACCTTNAGHPSLTRPFSPMQKSSGHPHGRRALPQPNAGNISVRSWA